MLISQRDLYYISARSLSEEFLGQRDDDARRASHVAKSVLVLVLGHLADEFGAVGAQPSDGVVDAFDCKHDTPEAHRVRRCDRRFHLDQFWIAKLRQLKLPVPVWGPHHNDVNLDIFEPVDAVHPRALDRHLAFDRHAEHGEKSDSGCKVIDDDADVVQSLDRHVPSIAEAVRGGPGRPFSSRGILSPSPLLALLDHFAYIGNRPYLNWSKSILKARKL